MWCQNLEIPRTIFFMSKVRCEGRWRMKLNFLKGSPPRIKYWFEEGLGGRYDLGVQWGAMEGNRFNPTLPSFSAGLGNWFKQSWAGILRGSEVFAGKLFELLLGPASDASQPPPLWKSPRSEPWLWILSYHQSLVHMPLKENQLGEILRLHSLPWKAGESNKG